MLKNMLIIIFILVLLGMGAYLLWPQKKVSSVRDALTKSTSFECDYIDEEGFQTKGYIKNGAIRTDFTAKNVEDSGSTIMVNKKIYIWWIQEKRGFSMDLAEAAAKGKTNEGMAQINNMINGLD